MASTSNSSLVQSDEYRNWLEIPSDLMVSIFLKIGVIDILKNVQKVCKSWRSICNDPAMWRTIDMINLLGYLSVEECDFEKLCVNLVDRSDGQLLEISIGCYCSDYLLHYISERSIWLRRLELECCCHPTNVGFCEMLKKLPYLEELHISHTFISKECILAAGKFCPLLKSFKLNRKVYRYMQIECDDEALAIAESMHNLTHLQLFGNKLTNLGLQAILDNCSRLEYLDLRCCLSILLEGDMLEKCRQQVKVLRYPGEKIDEYGFDIEIEDWDSSHEDYPCGFSDVDLSDDGDYYEFSDNDEYETLFGW